VSPVLLLLLLAALLYRVVTSVTDREDSGGGGLIKWTSASEAAGLARASGKPILYDFTAEWCGPCKVLDRQGWSDEKIAALVNESYVPARVVDRAREEGRNPAWIDELERRYRVSAFPTLVVAGADGREIAIAQGFGGKARLLEFLESSRKRGPIP
jgi:thiol:disulfide interchange protein